jgi:hypothetical protein
MRQKDLIHISNLLFGQKSPMKIGVANGLNTRTEMQISTKAANTFCFVLASLTFAVIFHDSIECITSRVYPTAGEEVYLSHSSNKYLSRFQGSIEAGRSASVHQQPGCPLLPPGRASDAR